MNGRAGRIPGKSSDVQTYRPGQQLFDKAETCSAVQQNNKYLNILTPNSDKGM